MSHLPLELILAILECAYYTPTGSPDYALLASCSLVCTSWSTPAQSLLFRRISISQRDTEILAVLLSPTLRQAPLGHAVRALNITVGARFDDTAWSPDVFAQFLEACPALYELTLSASGLHELDQFALAKLKHAGQSIRALNLQLCGVQSPLLFQLLGIWPRIRFLKIGAEIAAWPWRQQGRTPVLRPSRSSAGGVRDHDMVQRPPSHVALYDLALSRLPQPAVLAWLLGSSTTSLRILDLRELPGIAALETLAVHTPHLRSLRLLHFNMDSAALLRQCTRLEEFVIYNIPVIIPLAPELPPTIEHLSFRNPNHALRHTLRPILDAIRVLPQLRIVTCDKNSERLRDFVSLEKKCTKRGVEVVISEVPFWEYEDPVVVARFPRRRSVSNFGLMTHGHGGD